MIDPRDYPAFWGLCGGLLSGAHGLVSAYSAKAGTPEARRRAWLKLAFGLIAGPVVADAAVPQVLSAIPALAQQVAGLALGWTVASNPKGFGDILTRTVRAVFNQEPRS